jgi:hypothetical protein
MYEDFFHNLLKVILTALVILGFQIITIVLASRFGWFLWIIKKVMDIRSKYLHKKFNSKEHSHPED